MAIWLSLSGGETWARLGVKSRHEGARAKPAPAALWSTGLSDLPRAAAHLIFYLMQTSNRPFDDLAAILTGAAGAAKGARDEIALLLRQQGERVAADLALASREEVEVVKDLVREGLERIEALEARIAAIEARLAGPEADAATQGSPVVNGQSAVGAD